MLNTTALNIDELLCFDNKDNDGPVMRPADIKAAYPACKREFNGTNFYYGINPENKDSFLASNSALNETHTAFFEDMLDDLQTGAASRKTIILGLEPPQMAAPYLFVDANMALVRQLAIELNEYEQRAITAGKELRIVIRYASEMNDRKLSSAPDTGNRYAGDPRSYKASFRSVRQAFRDGAPRIEFAFSPAIRRDLTEPGLSDYWPGDDVVDVISCTWYIGADADFKVCDAFFIAYILHREGKGKPFGIDELGGCETVIKNGAPFGDGNDAMLQRMLGTVAGLKQEGIHFSYTTVFLEGKWGDTATLSWLK